MVHGRFCVVRPAAHYQNPADAESAGFSCEASSFNDFRAVRQDGHLLLDRRAKVINAGIIIRAFIPGVAAGQGVQLFPGKLIAGFLGDGQ